MPLGLHPSPWRQFSYLCSIALLVIIECSAVKAYLSPVYDIPSGINHRFNCPNNTPLHSMSSNFTSNNVRITIQLKCEDTLSHIPFSACGETVLTLTTAYVCEKNCFISGVLISNRTILNFMCSKPDEEYYQLTNCSWVPSIGHHSLPNSSLIAGFIKRSGFPMFIIHKYRLCFISTDICNSTKVEIDIEEFHAQKIGEGLWEFSCRNGYKLIGPDMYDCYEENNSNYMIKNNCEDCCEPVHIANVETSCTSNNLTKLHCQIGRILTGVSAYNTFCSSFLKNHGNFEFFCEACDKIIELCNSCTRSNRGQILCTSCMHPNGYPVTLTKNKKKCKIIAIVTSLTATRNIHSWDVLCVAIGSPKVIVSIYVDGVQQISVKQKRTTINEPIMPYNYFPKEVKCVASNVWGSNEQKIILSIQSILLDLQHVYAPFPGSRLIMNCVLKGDVDMWNWTMNDELIVSENSEYILLPNTSLEIKQVSQAHQGMYSCSAWNPIEVKVAYKTLYYTVIQSGSNHTMVLNVTGEPPRIIEWVDTYQAQEGSTVVLQCEVTGSPMPVIAWVRNEQFLLVTGVMDGYEICNETSIRLDNVSPTHEGYYFCIVGNIAGGDSKRAFVDVVRKYSTKSTISYSYSHSTSMPLLTTTPTYITSTYITSTYITSTYNGTKSTSIVYSTPPTFEFTSSHMTSDHMTPSSSSDNISCTSPSCVLLGHLFIIFIILLLMALFLCILKLANRQCNF